MSMHACPHYGSTLILTGNADAPHEIARCGESGWLCDMCKEDRADARTDREGGEE